MSWGTQVDVKSHQSQIPLTELQHQRCPIRLDMSSHQKLVGRTKAVAPWIGQRH